MAPNRSLAVVCLSLALLAVSTSGWAASAEERGFLSLYFSDEELEVVSATRSLKSIASVAENVAVVTAEDIALMNAHTVAEALYNVIGIELTDFKGPGSGGTASIQGSGTNRVAVLLDGTPLNTAGNNFALTRLPVQMIRKIEVIKGPASSAWGSSFGGVINVITKSFEPGEGAGGSVYASYGEEGTSDLRAELRGGNERLGITLIGSAMNSDGVQEGHEFRHGDLFAKASANPGRKTRLELSLSYHDSDSMNSDRRRFGFDVYDGYDLNTLYGKADLRTALTDALDLNLSAWALRQDDNYYEKRLSDNAWVRNTPTLYERYGFKGGLAWRTGPHVLVAGADFLDGRFEHHFEPRVEIDQQEYGVFVNDSITAGGLCLTPGLRYDHSNLAGGQTSPSLGLTYLASRDILFRALVSRGFHAPAIVKYFDAPPMGYFANKGLAPETVWSYQGGVEANVSDVLRTKLTLYYHDIDDILVPKFLGLPMRFTEQNAGRARSFGGELELATKTFGGLGFEASASYERVKLLDFTDPRHKPVREIYGFNAGATYAAGHGLRATVKGHYFWWDMTDAWQSDSNGLVVDGNVAKELLRRGGVTLEAFLTGHNLFNAPSFSDFLQQNPGRWFEAGARCSF